MKGKPPHKRKYPNQTMKLLYERGSCRDFRNKKITKRILNLILTAGTHAPTGGNLQPYSIIKVEKEGTRKRLAKMCFQKFMAKAPVHLLFCIDLYRLKKWAELEVAPFNAHNAFRCFWISLLDTAVCAQNICTAADSMGLASVYIGTVMEFPKQVKAIFELPKGVFPVILLCLGYPASKPVIRRKLGVDTVVHSERYRLLPNHQLSKVYREKYPRDYEVKKEWLPWIRNACKEVHGPKFAEKCLKEIRKTGYVKPAQFYFSMKYPAHKMPIGNEYFVRWFEKYGFNWFKRWIPYTKKNPKVK